MKKQKETVQVIFRRFKDGEILALFPYESTSGCDLVMSYQHIGQHSGADPLLVHDTNPATPEQYANLKRELEGIGYSLEVKQRINWKRYNEARRAAK